MIFCYGIKESRGEYIFVNFFDEYGNEEAQPGIGIMFEERLFPGGIVIVKMLPISESTSESCRYVCAGDMIIQQEDIYYA